MPCAIKTQNKRRAHRATPKHHFLRTREQQQSANGLEGFQVSYRLPPPPLPSVLPCQLLDHDLHVGDHGEGYSHPLGEDHRCRHLTGGMFFSDCQGENHSERSKHCSCYKTTKWLNATMTPCMLCCCCWTSHVLTLPARYKGRRSGETGY